MSKFPVKDANLNNVLIGSFWVPTIIEGSFVPGAAYAQGQCIGGLFMVPTGVIADDVVVQLAMLGLLGMTAGLGVDILMFEQNPTTSTFTDGLAAVVTAADIGKLAWRGSVAAQPVPYGVGVPMTFDGAPRRMMATDGAGHLYLAFISQGGIAITPGDAIWRVEVRN